MTAFLLVLAAMHAPARAWEHKGWVWKTRDIPLQWYLSDKEDDTIAFADVESIIGESYDNWSEVATCAELGDEYQGVREGYDLDQDEINNGEYVDGTLTFQMETVGLDSGVLGVTYTIETDETAFTFGDMTYHYAYDSDIFFNADVGWTTEVAIEKGLCSDAYSLEAVATHEIGHMWGLGHSCEEGDECDDVDLRNATMFWSGGACENDQASIEQDDLDGINALYGPYCAFAASEQTDTHGGVPLEVCFEVECSETPENVTWNFGDGTTSDELEPCHLYEEKGQFSISMTTSGAKTECGSWENTQREVALVLACGVPEPAEGFDGMFTYDHYDGLIYQMVNQADTSVYGCIDRIQWDVFKGSEKIQSISAWSPKIEFPKEGTYKVVLNIGGPGGVTAESLEIDAVDKPGEMSKGCATVPVGLGLAGLAAGLGAALARRRDD